MDNLDRRYGPESWAECRAESDGRRIRGYAIVFNSLSVNLGGFREIIAPEAVDRTLTEGLDVHAFYDHDTGKVLGRTRAGTLSLRKDRKGLAIEIDPDPSISYVSDVLRLVSRGDVTGMSFGFRALEDSWEDGKIPTRTVHDMVISEVSIVSKPAYSSTDVQVAQRSLRAFEEARAGRSIAFLQKWHRTAIAK